MYLFRIIVLASFFCAAAFANSSLINLGSDIKYTYETKRAENKSSSYPKNILLPQVKDYAIRRLDYKKYNEVLFRINKKKVKKNGEYWKADYFNITKDNTDFRPIISKEYKDKIIKLGATIVDDKDYFFIFEYVDGKNKYLTEFKTYKRSFSLKMVKEEVFVQDLVPSPDKIKAQLDTEGKITLDGVYFDFNKATLKKESLKAILSAVNLMEKYPDLVISVQGHTDSKGNDKYNKELSFERAKSVKDAIIKYGINKERLNSKGFGEENPIASNDTDEGRAKNRRVELHKISGGDKKAVIDINFIKPLENSVISLNTTYKDEKLVIYKTKPYFNKKEVLTFIGSIKRIDYKIMKDGKKDSTYSRKSIIKNYKNILPLYNAKILGEYSDSVYFEIKDRGDGKKVYGKIDAYSGSYNIFFLIED